MQTTPKDQMPFGDQTIINNNLHRIKYNYIPNEYVIWGKKVTNKTTALFHHAVECIDVESKLDQINEILSLL